MYISVVTIRGQVVQCMVSPVAPAKNRKTEKQTRHRHNARVIHMSFCDIRLNYCRWYCTVPAVCTDERTILCLADMENKPLEIYHC